MICELPERERLADRSNDNSSIYHQSTITPTQASDISIDPWSQNTSVRLDQLDGAQTPFPRIAAAGCTSCLWGKIVLAHHHYLSLGKRHRTLILLKLQL